MDQKNRRFLISGTSAAIGAALGAVSGSSSWIVVAIVAVFFALFATWIINGMVQ
ncbi:hypothetical protein HN604_01450 [archaeon]|jgi:hypothetical protein|nr:hypothetical protein [archaeon]MBT6182274.1 hypothetical protein [archaeon]MBT6606355.1 hypothetical protein [archaeon]MBT7251476.1 hypothetical protein [archaeon]MBT7660728.1 hypothetical protein [archaeon]